MAKVVIKDGEAFGSETDNTYDPFVLYYAWKERRDAHRPPHLVFANLGEDDEAAKAFLETYGPLTQRVARCSQQEAEAELGLSWYQSVRDAKERFEDPESYFRKYLAAPPIIHDPSKARRSRQLVRVNLSELWAEQEEFLLLQLLWEALRNRKALPEFRALFLGAARPRSRVVYGGESTPRILGDLQVVFRVSSPPSSGQHPYREDLTKALSKAIKRCGEADLERFARELISRRLSDHLKGVQPLLLPKDTGSATTKTLRPTWQVDTLLASLYMMLFLDISYERRVVRCGGCGILFADAKENVFFCSPRCETRARVRRWWRKNGKGYRRRRKQGSSGRPKTSKKKKRARTPRSP